MEQLELSVEDVLNLHRGWVTLLYVDQHKTEVEIVLRLQERGFLVSVAQLQACLRDWRLVSTSSFERCRQDTPHTPPSPGDEGKDVSSTRVSPSNTNKSYMPDDPEITAMYNSRPLPPLPPTSISLEPNISSSSSGGSSRKDRLSLTCHHGSSSSQTHKIQTSLEALASDGPSQLDLYVDDEQNHEMIVVGLTSPTLQYRRADNSATRVVRSRPRVRRGIRDGKSRVRKREEEEGRGARRA